MKHFRILAVLATTAILTFAFSTVAYAASDKTAGTASNTGSASSNASVVSTPAGTGTVINSSSDGNGKEFLTIMTADKNVFYLIIDRSQSSNNVYFLNAVTEEDLLSLAKKSGDTGSTVSSSNSANNSESTASTSSGSSVTASATTASKAQHSNSAATIVLVIVVVLIGGGAGYYFKIYRPKHQRAGMEDEDGYSPEDDAEPRGADEAGQDDDTPPWEESENDHAGESEDETK